jgi:hypothetical protein
MRFYQQTASGFTGKPYAVFCFPCLQTGFKGRKGFIFLLFPRLCFASPSVEVLTPEKEFSCDALLLFLGLVLK